MRRRSVGVLIAAAVAAGAGCGGAQAEPPSLPEQIGVVHEFRVEYTAGDATRQIRYWMLEEEGGGKRARIHWGGDELRDTSSRLAPSGGRLLSTMQLLVLSDDAPEGAIVGSGPEPVPLSLAGTAFSLEFYRELVRVGEALETEESAPAGCTDYAAPLVTHATGILDSVVAREQATVSTLDGSPSAVTIRLCGAQREVRRVSAPAFRIAMDEIGTSSLPAQEWRLTLVRRRPATEGLVADTFDLTRVYPQAPVAPGPGATPPTP